jgi:5-methylcytosine-specific restriction endonuclease McrA
MTERHRMRAPCPDCGCEIGDIETKNGQDVVRCAAPDCGHWCYNAPKKETGKPQRKVVTREGIKPSVRARVMLRAGGACELCHNESDPMHVGHLLSVDEGREDGLSDDALNSEENLAAMCEACNIGIGSMPIPLWLAVAIVMARTRILNRKAGV